MDFSFFKQFMKSRKGVYVTSGIVGVAAVAAITVAGVTYLGGNTDSSEQVMNDAVVVEKPIVLGTEMDVEEETTEVVADSEVQSDAETESESEEKQETKKTNTDKTQSTVKEKHILETEDIPLAQDIPVQDSENSESQEITTTSSQKTEIGTGQSTGNSGSSGNSNNSSTKPSGNQGQKDEYQLVWMDDFDGTELNTDDWNYEYHEPGWVNNELQEYVDSPENIYLEDGKLIIQALKTVDKSGNVSYTSGRVNTQNKHDYKYGRFEARAKVPSGKGFLPAFWMMPTDESFYGQWPKCGEIDIMEVLGDNLTTSHGTLHFGEPHTQSQGEYVLTKGDFASEFHVFACEWEPGEIRFYVDGKLFHTENDWFTKKEGFGEVAYPAPYDQPFYMILNLAVGGDWPGNPNPDAVFGDNAQLVVDYVKVYQKDSYNENVQKPEKEEVVLGKPDATGNYIRNGKFSVKESLSDSENWQFMLAGEGAATAEIYDNALHIMTTNAGSLDYSVQVVQAKQSLEQGYKYRLSFDAYADENRTIITSVTAPNLNYSRYLNDTKINLTTEAKNYSFEFDMLSDSDANGRVEFNLGNQSSTATVHITNVRLEQIEAIEIPEEVKTVLPDGNYVYNGEFQQGIDRLDYWEVEKNCDGAQISVTNNNGTRELKVAVPDTVSDLKDVIVKQSTIAISGGKSYELSFDAYADRNKTIKTVIGDKTFESTLTTEKKAYHYTFETEGNVNGADISFLLGAAGVTYIDNVRVQEDGMLINGDFSNGITGYEVYAYTASDVYYIVDSIKENNAFSIDIANTGDADWKIQLKQNNITLEKGKWYKLTLDVKSTLNRKIMYALQKDGTSDNDWTPYSESVVIDLDGEYETFSTTFQMIYPTDEHTILSISMGAVGGTIIDQKHTVVIDNIKLEEVEEPVKEPGEEVTAGTELIKNGDFANGSEGWGSEGSWILLPATGSVDFSDGKAVYDITNPGEADWNVQLKQSGLTLEQGASYKVHFKIKSSEARTVKLALMTAGTYDWYDGADIVLNADKELSFEKEFKVEKATSDIIDFQISLGKIDGVETSASVIEISDISLVKLGEEGKNPSDEISGVEIEAGTELITNGNFAKGEENWENAITAPGEATVTFADGKAVYNVTNPGTQDWHIQLKQSGLTLENGESYQVSFKIESSEDRTVKYALLNPDAEYAWYGGEDLSLNAGEVRIIDNTIKINLDTADTIQFVISMGLVGDTSASVIEISDISIVKLGEDVQTLGEEVVVEETTLTEEEAEEVASTEETEEETASTEEKEEVAASIEEIEEITSTEVPVTKETTITEQ